MNHAALSTDGAVILYGGGMIEVSSGKGGGRPVVLTVAGSDSGGGAGIQADLLTMTALGAHGTTALTCLTAQNPDGVRAVEAVESAFLQAQMEAVFGYFDVRAVKTGMLYNQALIETVACVMAAHPGLPLVVDPVMVATSGAVLLRPEAIQTLRQRLFPLASLLTPNLDEAAVLLGWRPCHSSGMAKAVAQLATQAGCAVLLKGGHLPGDRLVDVLAAADGTILKRFRHRREPGVQTHGSGCTLSAAIATGLAHGLALPEAVGLALRYLKAGLRDPIRVGGHSFIAHLPPRVVRRAKDFTAHS